MIIRHLGHSKFLIRLESGYRVLTDPFDATTGYPVPKVQADTVLVSHHHHDHDAVDTVEITSGVVDTAGTREIAPGVRVISLPSFHDDAEGSKRGANLIHILEAEGLRVVHLGDLGHLPDEKLTQAIGQADILMVPVGGFFTIDALQAREICTMLKARVIIPMHYRTQYNASWPITELDGFLTLFPDGGEEVDLLRVTREDLSCQMHVAVIRDTFTDF
ncbi:MAG: MBL fold metallo-hydrolase [Clostridia bacterium]|nr:MBL fold metallo-hydrolase [Clostridia bacterium]